MNSAVYHGCLHLRRFYVAEAYLFWGQPHYSPHDHPHGPRTTSTTLDAAAGSINPNSHPRTYLSLPMPIFRRLRYIRLVVAGPHDLDAFSSDVDPKYTASIWPHVDSFSVPSVVGVPRRSTQRSLRPVDTSPLIHLFFTFSPPPSIVSSRITFSHTLIIVISSYHSSHSDILYAFLFAYFCIVHRAHL